MKKLTALLLACALAFSLAACAGAGQGANSSSQNSAPSAAQEAAGASSQPIENAGTAEGTGTEGQTNILVAYFSWANNAILAEDVDAVASPSVITPGNVQQLAEWVQQETGGRPVFDSRGRALPQRLGRLPGPRQPGARRQRPARACGKCREPFSI